METSQGVCVQLLTSKTKVAPLKVKTTPRLELLSCLLLTMLLKSILRIVTEKLKNASITCWNDSSSAIGWIRGEEKRWSKWVEDKASKVRAVVESRYWRHVPGKLNPADVATREISPDDIAQDSVWFAAPAFLYDKPETWPVTPVDQDITLELKDASRKVVVTNVVSHWEPVIKIEDYSSLYRLYCAVAFILRYKKNCLARCRNEEKNSW